MKKEGLQQYKNSQETGSLFSDELTPFEKIAKETNFLKVIKVFESSRLEADPVFVLETIRSAARCLPAYMRNLISISKESNQAGIKSPKLSQTKYDLKFENILTYAEKYQKDFQA